MSSKRYTDEFKIEAVRQVTDRGFKVAEVAERLGVTTHSLYAWLRKFGKPGVVQRAEADHTDGANPQSLPTLWSTWPACRRARAGRASELVAPEKPQPPNDRKALMSAPACQNYQCSLR